MSSIANTTHSPTVVDYDPFAGSAILRVVPTTESQREVWLADQFGEDASLAFNESVSLRFKGPLQVDALIGALQELVQRHEALRATTSANGEELVIAADAVINVELSNFTSLNAVDQDANISAARQRVVETPFHVEKGPLFRAEILKFGSEDHFLILTAHHIICDGWSFGILVRDLAKLYAHRTNGIDSALAPARSFGDYASALADAHGNESQMADEKYWLSRFTGTPPVLDLPTDRARPVWRTFSARREDYVLDAALVADVRKIGALSGSSLDSTKQLCGANTTSWWLDRCCDRRSGRRSICGRV